MTAVPTKSEPPDEVVGDLRRTIAWGTISNVAGTVVTYGAWFFLTPFILHRVGPTNFGLWALVGSLVSFGALLDLGVGTAVAKYVAEFHARRKYTELRHTVATAFWLYVGAGVLAAVIAAALATEVPDLFNLSEAQRSTAEWLTVVAGLAVAVELPTSITYSILRGLQEFRLINLIGACGMLVLSGTIVAVLLAGGGLVGIVVANIAVTLVVQVPMVWAIRRRLPQASVSRHLVQRSRVRTIMSYGSAVFVIDAAAKIGTRTDEIVIAAFLPVSRVTPYSLARRVSSVPQLIAAQLDAVILPTAASLEALTETDRLRRLALASTRLTLVSFLPIACPLVVLAGPLLGAWVGEGYENRTTLVLILVAASLVTMSAWPAASTLQAMSRHRRLAVFAMGVSIANLGLSIALVRPLGVEGVALATLIVTAVEVIVLIGPYAIRTIGTSLHEVVHESLAPALLPVPTTLALLYVLRRVTDPEALPYVLAVGAVGSLAYLATYAAFCARPDERAVVRSTTERLRRAASPRR